MKQSVGFKELSTVWPLTCLVSLALFCSINIRIRWSCAEKHVVVQLPTAETTGSTNTCGVHWLKTCR